MTGDSTPGPDAPGVLLHVQPARLQAPAWDALSLLAFIVCVLHSVTVYLALAGDLEYERSDRVTVATRFDDRKNSDHYWCMEREREKNNVIKYYFPLFSYTPPLPASSSFVYSFFLLFVFILFILFSVISPKKKIQDENILRTIYPKCASSVV